MAQREIRTLTDDELQGLIDSPDLNINLFGVLTEDEQARMLAIQPGDPEAFVSGLSTESRRQDDIFEEEPSNIESMLSGAGNLSLGFGKEALNTLMDAADATRTGLTAQYEFGDLGTRLLEAGSRGDVDERNAMLDAAGAPGSRNREMMDRFLGEDPLEPLPLKGTAQEIGGGVERVAEMFAPASRARSGGAALMRLLTQRAQAAGRRPHLAQTVLPHALRTPRITSAGPALPGLGGAAARRRDIVSEIPRMTGPDPGLRWADILGRAGGESGSTAAVSALQGRDPDAPAALTGGASIAGSLLEKFLEVPVFRRLAPLIAGGLGTQAAAKVSKGGAISAFGMSRQLGEEGLERPGVIRGINRLISRLGRGAASAENERQRARMGDTEQQLRSVLTAPPQGQARRRQPLP
jgi:hypothetical protein